MGRTGPRPVRRKTIDKPDGGERQLGIPNVLDRLIQQAIVQVLTPVFDPGFSESSHGFRPKRSAHGAAKQVQRTIRRGHRFVVDMDFSKFFDRVPHDVLMSRVSRKVSDKRLLTLIGRYLRAGVMVEGILQPTHEGTPQGGPMSPLLANILLDDLDKELERRGLPFVRYADDFVIFTKSQRSAERVFASVERYLTQHLRLVVNQEKSRIAASDGLEFLSYVFRGKRATINVSSKTIKGFKRRIREITGRSRGISMDHRLGELGRYVRGWMGYFGLAVAIETVRQTRPVDTASHPDVLLETLASCAHASPRTHSIRRPASPSHPSRQKSPRPLAHGQNHRQRCWDDECVVTRTGHAEPENTLGGTCSASPNRLMRTRMSGGVGRAVSNGRPYPISRTYCGAGRRMSRQAGAPKCSSEQWPSQSSSASVVART